MCGMLARCICGSFISDAAYLKCCSKSSCTACFNSTAQTKIDAAGFPSARNIPLVLVVCGHISLGSSMLSDVIYCDYAIVLSNILQAGPGPCIRQSNISVWRLISSFWNEPKMHHLFKSFLPQIFQKCNKGKFA